MYFPLLLRSCRRQCKCSAQIPSDHFCIPTAPQHTHITYFGEWFLWPVPACSLFSMLLLVYCGSHGPLGNTRKVCSLPGCRLINDYQVGNKTILKQLTLQSSLWNEAQVYPLNSFCLKSHPCLGSPSLPCLISPTCLSFAHESSLGLLLENEPKTSGTLRCITGGNIYF